jgi:release factor glutamine methyltransferase
LNLVEYLQKATSYLQRHDVPSPRLEAELMLVDLLGISRLDIYTGFERMLSPEETDAYREMLARRAAGWPLQYLTGAAGFRGLTLEVRPGVFIPRPETEVVVEKALEVLPAGQPGLEVLDLGCGCGSIALSVAVERPGARVTAVDCEPAAVELTVRNAGKCGVADRVNVMEGDLFEPLARTGAAFDVVVSNPPYVPAGCKDALPVDVREFEPPGALFAGEEGLDVIERIVDGAPAYLKAGGWLVLEVDESHAEKVMAELLAPRASGGEGTGEGEAVPTWTDGDLFEDLAGRPRVARARLAG